MTFLQKINNEYFNNELSPDVLELLAPMDEERPEMHQWIERMSRYMHRQGIGATDFSEASAWVISTFIPKLLPDAWDGVVPPITLKGRHRKLDHYLANNPWNPLGAGSSFLDLGCGFPPETSMDTAAALPEVKVLGADPSFGRYLIKDAENNYACFNAESELLYFQPESFEIDRWEAMYADTETTRKRYLDYLAQAKPSLKAGPGEYQTWEGGGITVQQNPILQFESSNLRFVQQGIGSQFDRKFDAIRCMNVLIYFDRAFRGRAVEWAATQLADGGLLVTGMNWSHSRTSRYAVYQSVNSRMKMREFAISIDNLRPLEISAWFTLEENDYETVAMVEVVRQLRHNHDFIQSFDSRLDELYKEQDFCARKDNGYLGRFSKKSESDPEHIDSAPNNVNRALENEGYVEAAVDILNENGLKAWVNCAGHIAVNPEGLNV